MGIVQLPDALERVIDQQVAEGRAPSRAAFLEHAVMHLIQDAHAEDEDIGAVIEAGEADIAAGRYTTINTPQDTQDLMDGIMARVRASLTSDR